MNPMIGKELRQRMRERRGWLLPTLYLTTLGVVVVFYYYFQVAMGRPWMSRNLQGFEIGTGLFFTLTYAQLSILLLLAPVFSAGVITIEKEQRTLPGLLTSLLTPLQIWWGKFFASGMFLVLLLLSSVPILSLVFAFGGIGPRQVLLATLTTLFVLATVTSIGLYCSAYFRRSVHATAVTYAIIIVVTVVSGIVFGILMSHWERARMHEANGAAAVGIATAPLWVRAPLFINPYFLVTLSFGTRQDWSSDGLASLTTFLILFLFSFTFAVRHIRHSGEQS
jgi:ABC-type transport system involved in multi-copper enzyme maturation permease subunit